MQHNQTSPTTTDNFQVYDAYTNKYILMNHCTNRVKVDGDNCGLSIMNNENLREASKDWSVTS